ncbi:PI-PLC domain-containing protein [Pseudobutyrivibrio ruminis]|uniref:Bacterial repeat domain-containing protein n=1 Tax=Pseudobutyrivibrio ruminis DSM 9787 TaxID=1123011 RepID=A0A285T530_9FIRM|nr:hypothetical protein [Pseudobutyrivibrio ruminis]SOC16467.1 hypothetical protein SAMN02910411_0410 [Pseudobutyrivibrio ruminis DSM 9787]
MKKLIFLSLMVLCLGLTSCAKEDNKVNDVAKKVFTGVADIEDDENYKQYKELDDAGQLSEDGMYKEASSLVNEDESEEVRPAQVLVTFAENDNLNISYYKDSGMQEQIEGSCYLNPNEAVYANVAVSNDAKSNLYKFSEFKIFEYDETGKATEVNWANTNNDENLVFQIPMDYTGKDISVVPVGMYEKRELLLNDYYIDEDGNSKSLAGAWTVDNEETDSNSIKISSVTSYLVSYQYDSSKYFFVKSEPEAQYQDNDDGVVIFEEGKAFSDVGKYNIELHPYITVQLKGNREWTYKVNKVSAGDEKKEQTISGLKYNDKITVESKKKIDWDYNDSLLSYDEDKVDDGYEYTFVVKEANASFMFDPNEYTYPHGSLRFKCRGQILTERTYIGEGSQIEYECETVDDGYWLPNGNHSITVSTAEQTKQELSSIKFFEKKEVTVNLPQPSYGGSIVYYNNDSEIKGNNVKVYAGTPISLDFVGWEGWICNYEDGYQYRSTEDSSQQVSIEGKEVDIAFTEDESHKPELTVVLDNSLETDLKVSVNASSFSTEKHYKDGILSGSTTIEAGKIGTENGISLGFANDTIKAGQALKITYKAKNADNKKYIEETRYVQKIPSTEIFNIYDANDIATAKDYYESVKISISRVDVNTFKSVSVDNGNVSLQYEDTGNTITNGDIVDNDRNVIVTITPDKGYYVSGSKNVSKDIYTNTMSYKKYKNDIEKIIKDHQIKKVFTVTLDSEDAYGDVLYKLNGTEVTGTINVREGQKIKLTYTISDSKYQIKTGFVHLPGAGKEQSVEIKIDSSLDGKTIKREDYFDVESK